jgi:hypothetical protein
MLIVKVHKAQDGRRLVAICDKALLGKRFEEGKRQLDLTSSFYKGEEMGEQDAEAMLKGEFHLNLVGKEAVALGLRLGLVDQDGVMTIAGVPHAESSIG